MLKEPDAARITTRDGSLPVVAGQEDVIRSLREATIVAEQRLGEALGRIKQLETDLARSQRNTTLIQQKVVRPIYHYLRWFPGVRRFVSYIKR